MTRPSRIWVLKYQMRAAVVYAVYLYREEALTTEARVRLMGAREVEIWECGVKL